MENLKKLKKSFSKALNISVDVINDDLLYQGIPQWDSISHMVLISQLEEDFDLSIDTDDVIDLSSFQKAKDILHKLGVNFE